LLHLLVTLKSKTLLTLTVTSLRVTSYYQKCLAR